jgi:hypothetical protein
MPCEFAKARLCGSGSKRINVHVFRDNVQTNQNVLTLDHPPDSGPMFLMLRVSLAIWAYEVSFAHYISCLGAWLVGKLRNMIEPCEPLELS